MVGREVRRLAEVARSRDYNLNPGARSVADRKLADKVKTDRRAALYVIQRKELASQEVRVDEGQQLLGEIALRHPSVAKKALRKDYPSLDLELIAGAASTLEGVARRIVFWHNKVRSDAASR